MLQRRCRTEDQVSVPYVAGFSAGSRWGMELFLGIKECFSALCGGLFGWIRKEFDCFGQILHVSVPYVAGFSAGSQEGPGATDAAGTFQCPMWRAFRLDLRETVLLSRNDWSFSALCGGLFGWILKSKQTGAITHASFSALCGGLFGWIRKVNTAVFVIKTFQCPMWRAFRLDQCACLKHIVL